MLHVRWGGSGSGGCGGEFTRCQSLKRVKKEAGGMKMRFTKILCYTRQHLTGWEGWVTSLSVQKGEWLTKIQQDLVLHTAASDWMGRVGYLSQGPACPRESLG